MMKLITINHKLIILLTTYNSLVKNDKTKVFENKSTHDQYKQNKNNGY